MNDMNDKHTPGPWDISPADEDSLVIHTSVELARVYERACGGPLPAAANARVIGNAPALLALAKRAVDLLDTHVHR